MANVALRGVSKAFSGGIRAASEIDLEVDDGELFVVVGPSGSGKSTLLRLIAGLESPGEGTVWIGDRRVDPLPPADRDVAMVFQNPALYPHLTVFDNLAFGLRARRRPKAAIQAEVASIAGRLGLDDLLGRRPRTLSGGQRQRVALGRAIVRRPSVFLLDEPFSSLDAPLRASMRADLVELHRTSPTTTILVTHDQAEALAIGDRIAVMDRGRIVQIGSPADIYQRPATRFVAEFMGQPPMNILRCELETSDNHLMIRLAGVDEGPAWNLPTTSKGAMPLAGRHAGAIDLGIRPEAIAVAGEGIEDEPGSTCRRVMTRVQRLERLGHETIATVALGPYLLNLRLSPSATPAVGDRLAIGLDLGRASWFDAESGRACPSIESIAT